MSPQNTIPRKHLPHSGWCLLTVSGRYEEVVRLQETLCDLKRQFQQLQLEDVNKDNMKQRALYKTAQKVILTRTASSVGYNAIVVGRMERWRVHLGDIVGGVLMITHVIVLIVVDH